ncbi:nitrate ABC transporter permease [Thauera sp. CAU 1555]|uniref:Nitrate ABC transporter permease n=1 Tax=Thauera sedimentorum TaxID=2767595 RepID=A0ABR9B4Z0_9RHOO|nr:nitrate ABC transporter permease [Thauera sedimentorum]MBC9070500.1 nitrate ABC transporter permease [Thauera sedimentorum]MBD8501420.1 nitrate ABC transporter permease [Thauera sedimentorum]
MSSIPLTLDKAAAAPAADKPARPAARSVPLQAVAEKPPAVPLAERLGPWINQAIRSTVAALSGLAVLLVIWWAVADSLDTFPGPRATWQAAVELLAEPFYSNGPNDMGIGWNVLYSLGRVGVGFGLAALVGIPLGFIVGRFRFMSTAAEPVIGLLRPVSPLAWLPIGLLVFQEANLAAIWVIFVCSIWPMIINTAAGVRAVPQDYLNVARVLNLSEWKVVTRILFPAVLPSILTGVRLAVGTAWLVIVAAEMLTGGIGIGFWVWDEWNNLKVEHILIAIVIIGLVGLALEHALLLVARRFSFEAR